MANCSSDGHSPTRADYIKKADAICQRHNAYQEHTAEDLAKARTSPHAAQTAYDDIINDARSEARELGDLTPPSADEHQLQLLVRNLRSGLDESEANAPSQFLAAAISRTPKTLIAAQAAAKAYGLQHCGNGAP